MVFPWQIEQWQQLARARQENRLPHALLFTGMAGTGKSHFARQFVSALLCQANTGMPCAQPALSSSFQFIAEETIASATQPPSFCHSCYLIKGGSHPNLRWIEPENGGHAIKIDQIREVGEFINQSILQGPYNIVVINDAHYLNVNAANALLKTLEEPAPGSILILISDRYALLPATILSRCQRLIFPRPENKTAHQWLKQQMGSEALAEQKTPEFLLKLTNGAPLTALQWWKRNVFALREQVFQGLHALCLQQENPLALALRWQEADPVMLLDLILSWLIDLLRLQLAGQEAEIANQDYAASFMTLSKQTDPQKNLKFMVHLQSWRKQIFSGLNLNKQLMLEGLLIIWT